MVASLDRAVVTRSVVNALVETFPEEIIVVSSLSVDCVVTTMREERKDVQRSILIADCRIFILMLTEQVSCVVCVRPVVNTANTTLYNNTTIFHYASHTPCNKSWFPGGEWVDTLQ